MLYSIIFISALAGSASALPNFLYARQGVTAQIAPPGAAPSGFVDTLSSTFGIAVFNSTAGSDAGSPSVTQIGDGQPQVTTAPDVTQISDGQPQVVTMGMVTQINDGQVQAPTSHAPITVTPVTQITDGQPQAPAPTAPAPPPATETPVSQIGDGQPQVPPATETPVSQISDGQPQVPPPTEPAPPPPATTEIPVSQITDGQPQAPSATEPAPPPATVTPVSQISDGQPQAPPATETPVSQITDGQPQVPPPTEPAPPPPATTETLVSQVTDGQPQAPGTPPVAPTTLQTQVAQPPAADLTSAIPQAPSATEPMVMVTQIHDGQVQAPPVKRTVSSKRAIMAQVGCTTSSTLTLTLTNGILTDKNGRTGYIASNRQFQFDDPPQAGALFTAGWSVGPDGTLALGPSTEFWQCLSGDFFNLYDQDIAAQCNQVTINTLMLQQC